jgi:hypothetical protein
MLSKVCAHFVEKSPISVMVRGTLERVLGADQFAAWFARTAQKQYTRTVLFSTVFDVLSPVVFRITPAVRAAYRDHADPGGASRISVYNKLHGGATHTSAELVRYSATVLRPLITRSVALAHRGCRRGGARLSMAMAWQLPSLGSRNCAHCTLGRCQASRGSSMHLPICTCRGGRGVGDRSLAV